MHQFHTCVFVYSVFVCSVLVYLYIMYLHICIFDQLVSTYMLYISAAIIGLGAPVIWTAQVYTSFVYYNGFHIYYVYATYIKMNGHLDGAG